MAENERPPGRTPAEELQRLADWLNKGGGSFFQVTRFDQRIFVSVDGIKGASDQLAAAKEEAKGLRDLVCRYLNDCEIVERMIDTAMSGESDKLTRSDWVTMSASLGVTAIMAREALAAAQEGRGG